MVTWSQIQTQIDRIRCTHRVRSLTNCFTPLMDALDLSMLASDSSVVFACAEKDFSRLYYYSTDVASLALVLADFKSILPLVIGYVDKTKNENLCAAFRSTGFEETAHYLRMSSAAFLIPEVAEQSEFATVEEADAVMSLLRSTFNPVTDYLPSHERLRSLIEQQQVIVRREVGQITGLVAFQVLGRQVHFNYLLNLGRRGDGSVLKQSFFRCMAERGFTSGFLWVDSTNQRAHKIYSANGWKADGLNDWFFTRPAA
jgi:hypothetical protein